MVAASALIGCSGGDRGESTSTTSTQGFVPYELVSDLRPPPTPPVARIAGSAGAGPLDPFFVDWDMVDSSRSVPLPATVAWPERETPRDLEVILETRQIPTRVIVYSSADLGPGGRPKLEPGTEWYCARQAGERQCSFGRSGGRIVVKVPGSGPPHEHLVLHAAWEGGVTGEGEDITASASWAWARAAT